jgi:uncharacterized repeat protein (TIGR03806 family)
VRRIAFWCLAVSVFAAPASGQVCAGDCDGDGSVAIGELILGVNVALGRAEVTGCASLDRDGDGRVTVGDLVVAVRYALGGCPAVPTATATAIATPTPTVQVVENRCAVPLGDAVNFEVDQEFCELLSSYRFFVDGANQIPNDRVVPFDLNTPLFSDFALKHRFVWMPEGSSAAYDDTATFAFPVGTVILKTFSYPTDFRNLSLGERVIETRLLVRRSDGWAVITYLWNDEQTEARRRAIGAGVPVSFIDDTGEERSFRYQVPNTNQCRECHEESEGVLEPVGPKARHLNRDFAYDTGVDNQLSHWAAIGYLTGAPDPEEAPRVAVVDDPTSGSVEERARAYLDVNCGNCHNPGGLARTSGLFLSIDIDSPLQLGICKGPVAAGQGAGGRPFGIRPGDPDDSILVFRMESTRPGIAMPELGRVSVDDVGVAVVREWIESLEGDCGQP